MLVLHDAVLHDAVLPVAVLQDAVLRVAVLKDSVLQCYLICRPVSATKLLQLNLCPLRGLAGKNPTIRD